jgi:hypothetical protein
MSNPEDNSSNTEPETDSFSIEAVVKLLAENEARFKEKKWTWLSTQESRDAGQVSVLACVETLAAIALYWWIAIRFNSHQLLVSSVVVAPLLMLRSPESINSGVNWFWNCGVGPSSSFKTWPQARRIFFFGTLGTLTGALTFVFALWLCNHWLPGLAGWPLFRNAATIAMASLAFATGVSSASFCPAKYPRREVSEREDYYENADRNAHRDAAAIAAVVAGSLASLAAIATSAGVTALLGAVVGSVIGVFVWLWVGGMMGLVVRAFFFRVLATLRHLPLGAKRLPRNWQENVFFTDSTLPVELIPGIAKDEPLDSVYSSDKIIRHWIYTRKRGRLYFGLLAAPFLLLPAFFYRLNFKATAWFWWLLAYLLKPAPVGDKAEQQKQALCWPWTNPLEMILIVGPLAALLTSLISHYLNGSSWAAMKDVPYLPLRVLFSMDWADVTPWHWMQWVIVGSGAWMLKIAGNARSQDLNGNWQTYSQSWSKTIRLMTALQRIRALATLALLIMGLGALLLLDQTWREYVTVPDYWVAVLEQFYRRGH